MNVLLINGSPRREGNTHLALSQVAAALQGEGIASEILWIGTEPVRGCIACGKCAEPGRCVFKDALYEQILAKLPQIDALVVGTPTYYAGANGSLCAILDRVFYSAGRLLRYKPGAAVAVCRRGGSSSAFDRLNKYFTITDMPVVSSQYWNIVYGQKPGDAARDAEGLQTMRTLGRDMAWLLRNLQAGGTPPPAPEAERERTNFLG